MISKVEQKRMAGLEREKQVKRQRVSNRAWANAVTAVVNQPELVAVAGVSEVATEVVDENPPHISHDIKQMISARVIYCNTCSHWACHGKHSLLAQECEPLRSGNRTTLRLLQCDVVPAKGAKLPVALRKRHWALGEKRGG